MRVILVIKDGIKYMLYESKGRLEEAMGITEALKPKLPELYAKDFHGLVKCHSAKSIALCAEMVMRASLIRTETRGGHMREDYPEGDDRNWLKWIAFKKDGDKWNFRTEPLPVDKYKLKPPAM